jgi:ribosomal protein S18 acetylase RimI-like enzyme
MALILKALQGFFDLTSLCLMTNVRKATIDDLPALTVLNESLFNEDAGTRDPFVDLEWSGREAYLRALVADGERNLIWVADADADAGGQVVGYLVARLKDGNDIRPVLTAELESLYVQEDRRNGGHGAALVEHFLAWAKATGAGRAVVHAYAANTSAIRFYERFGMRPKSTMLDLAL